MIFVIFFFFNDTATTEIYTLSLHDALPIYDRRDPEPVAEPQRGARTGSTGAQRREAVLGGDQGHPRRSEEHTSELQSRQYLVCRLLLEKKKIITYQLLNTSHFTYWIIRTIR